MVPFHSNMRTPASSNGRYPERESGLSSGMSVAFGSRSLTSTPSWAAAQDGVDVRLLLPNATDIPLLRPLSRSGYRPLLEAGVRIFEWNGTMIHAKTAVCDGRWARVGSTNLNI